MATVEQRVGQANRSQLARELGVDRSYVSLVLSRKRTPSLDVAGRMARGLGVTLDEMYEYLQGAETAVTV